MKDYLMWLILWACGWATVFSACCIALVAAGLAA